MRKLWITLILTLACGAAHAQASSGYTKLNTSPVTTLTYTDSSCPLQTSCYYEVTSVDAQGFESIPGTCAATQLCVGGNQMYVQMPTSGTHTVTLSWIASSTPSVTYNVYRHIGPFGPTGGTATVN
jgi:hypothetical protein